MDRFPPNISEEHAFEEYDNEPVTSETFIVDVNGYEGPLDLLLALARKQKVDLRMISVLDLANQYLQFIEHMNRSRIRLAANYLVMAAWLAYLKSRLLLPEKPADDEIDADELAARLAFQLERLEAMRKCGTRLMASDRLGKDFFSRGCPEVAETRRRVSFTASILDLLQAYARVRTRDDFTPLSCSRSHVLTVEQALEQLRPLFRQAFEWDNLLRFMPRSWLADQAHCRSATASTFAAALELAKRGQIEIRQSESFAEIQVRARRS